MRANNTGLSLDTPLFAKQKAEGVLVGSPYGGKVPWGNFWLLYSESLKRDEMFLELKHKHKVET